MERKSLSRVHSRAIGACGGLILLPLEWGGDDGSSSMQSLGCTLLVTIFCGERMVSIWRTTVSFGECLPISDGMVEQIVSQ